MDGVSPSLRIDTETYADLAYRKLKEAILVGDLLPGSPLVERELEKAMGISRTPIRTACQILAAEGLVSSNPHRGAMVRTLTLDEARDAYELRMALEGMTVCLATERSSDKDLRWLKSEFVEQPTEADWYSDEQFLKRQEFHLAIARLSRNADLLLQLGHTNNRIALWRNNARHAGVEFRVTHAEHSEIVDLMINRKAREARQKMEDHIELSWENSTEK